MTQTQTMTHNNHSASNDQFETNVIYSDIFITIFEVDASNQN